MNEATMHLKNSPYNSTHDFTVCMSTGSFKKTPSASTPVTHLKQLRIVNKELIQLPPVWKIKEPSVIFTLEDQTRILYLNCIMYFADGTGFSESHGATTKQNYEEIGELCELLINGSLSTHLKLLRESLMKFNTHLTIVKQMIIFSHGIVKDEAQSIPFVSTPGKNEFDFQYPKATATTPACNFVDIFKYIYDFKCNSILFDCCSRVAGNENANNLRNDINIPEGKKIIIQKDLSFEEIIKKALFSPNQYTAYCLSLNQAAYVSTYGSHMSFFASKAKRKNCQFVDGKTLAQNLKRYTTMELNKYQINWRNFIPTIEQDFSKKDFDNNMQFQNRKFEPPPPNPQNNPPFPHNPPNGPPHPNNPSPYSSNGPSYPYNPLNGPPNPSPSHPLNPSPPHPLPSPYPSNGPSYPHNPLNGPPNPAPFVHNPSPHSSFSHSGPPYYAQPMEPRPGLIHQPSLNDVFFPDRK